jgi:hypothetical protein
METPEYSANEGTPDALPKGAATDLNQGMELVEDVDLAVEEPAQFPEDELAGLEDVPPMEGELTGLDKLVFGGTDRPDEPLTAGANFGPGPMGVEGDGRTSDQKLADMALYSLNTNRELSPRSKSIMARIIRGD